MSKPLMREESDSMGVIEVEQSRYWGAQTQRSLHHFANGNEHMPIEVVHAFAYVKWAAALSNASLGLLDNDKAKWIEQAAREITEGKWDEHFPLYVWQTGSGTQSNMNTNEVIANRANELAGRPLGTKAPVHPNDHVNASQSSNDTFPTAMHIAAYLKASKTLLPALKTLLASLEAKQKAFESIVKIGRTHLQDAVPLTLGQEFSAFCYQLKGDITHIEHTLPELCHLALGGTAVGTGLNTHPKFAHMACEKIAELTGAPFRHADNAFAALASHQAITHLSGHLNALATNLMKIANDIRWLGSGPRCGIGELHLPENEPGSSIMPGKVNPTQCEALTMACAQVMGNHTTISIANSQGNFQLNVYKPVIAYNLLQSMQLLADTAKHFAEFAIDGLEANTAQINTYLERSLMLVTALSPHIGYDNAAKAAHTAHVENLSLKEVCCSKMQLLSEEAFDQYVNPLAMAHPHKES